MAYKLEWSSQSVYFTCNINGTRTIAGLVFGLYVQTIYFTIFSISTLLFLSYKIKNFARASKIKNRGYAYGPRFAVISKVKKHAKDI